MPIYKDKIVCPICTRRCGMQRTHKLVCSAKCKRIYLNTPIVNTRQIIKCANCDTEFQPKSSTNIYCSKMCSSIYIKERVKVYTSDFSIFERDEFRCIYCGKSSIEHGVELHVDHIVPLVLGGVAMPSNLITACKLCNVSKNANELTDEVRLRIYNVLLTRNKGLSIQQYSAIEREVDSIKYRDKYRHH